MPVSDSDSNTLINLETAVVANTDRVLSSAKL